MSEMIRWGILGCGKIARKFATGIADSPESHLVAAASRSIEKARQLASEFDIPRSHGSYDALAADPEVDAIYVATPHAMHKDHSILCLRAGKAVLCEKPFAINAGQGAEMVAAANESGRFLMEAMWTRFLPSVQRVRSLIDEGAIGSVRMIIADFGFRTGFDPTSRLFDLSLGGGGLLDVGIYPISLASYVMGSQPSSIASTAEIGDTGVDEQAGILFTYAGGEIALIATGIRTSTPHEAAIIGTDGSIKLHPTWWNGTGGMTLHRGGADPEEIVVEQRGNGYNYQADEVCRCLRSGAVMSEVMGLTESVEILKTLDAIRSQWGLVYPMEGDRNDLRHN